MAKEISYKLDNGLNISSGYLRLNHFETISKQQAVAVFRAYSSPEMVTDQTPSNQNKYFDEFEVSFVPDPDMPLWLQAYDSLLIWVPDQKVEEDKNYALQNVDRLDAEIEAIRDKISANTPVVRAEALEDGPIPSSDVGTPDQEQLRDLENKLASLEEERSLFEKELVEIERRMQKNKEWTTSIEAARDV